MNNFEDFGATTRQNHLGISSLEFGGLGLRLGKM